MNTVFTARQQVMEDREAGIDCHQQRAPYSQAVFNVEDLVSTDNPVVQFQAWFTEARACPGITEPQAMSLATCTADGKPSVRVVLMKQIDKSGLVFYTNYDSRKGRELEANPQAAAVFYWGPLHRQIRVEGRVERVSVEQSEMYFHSRPYDSQVSASASPQSTIIASREVLVQEVERLKTAYPDLVPCPPHWGGYRLIPSSFEFWQGQSSRLHDRLVFTNHGGDTWKLTRLAP